MTITAQPPHDEVTTQTVTAHKLETITAPDLRPVYKFMKVEDYFEGYRNWNVLTQVMAHHFDGQITLSLTFQRHDGQNCMMLIQFLRRDIMRVRFNPNCVEADNYTSQNTRLTVQDTLQQLLAILDTVTVDYKEQTDPDGNRTLHLTTKGQDQQPFMEVVVGCNPFYIKIMKYAGNQAFRVWKTAVPALYYTPNKDGEYSIIQAVEKPATAKYIGFGEQGGKELSKNTAQLTYFNFDNMRYRQVYDRGPFDNREPLYHSDPFFMEFNGLVDEDKTSMYGMFLEKPSQVYVDVGYSNSQRYLVGTRFGNLSYYFFLGETCPNILDAFTAIVGRPGLKPRYVLGYHQGCYGYETRQDLEEAVRKYRACQIPLDGLHVDVDIQHHYQTFTIDDGKFPNPQEMFANLRAQGVKCSTNITPIVSNQDPNYTTYHEGLARGYFVLDKRVDPDDPDGRRYQDFGGGQEYYQHFTDPEGHFNSGKPYIGEVYYGGDRGTTGHYPDLARKEVREWWGRQYQYIFDMGLEMVWQDMTTPAIRNTRGDMRSFPFRLLVTDDFLSDVDPKQRTQTPAIKVWNLYAYNLHKATYHGLNHLQGRENKRNFIIGRGSFTGMHRFAGLWTGDNASSWEFFRINIAQVLAIGLCGIAISGEDIGGFESEQNWQKWADPELLIRWTCAGAFLPWFRNHYIKKGVKLFQEPYAYQDVNLDEWHVPQDQRYLYGCVLPICKHYIELRYRLLQLFYDAMFENVLNGMPICRAMILNDPNDKALYNDKLPFLDNQFFVRHDLLIAPMIEPQSQINGNGMRDIYLPAGSDWYAFMDNRRPLMVHIEGGTTIRDFDAHIAANADHMSFIVPMYVRAGAILPTLELEQYIGERNAHNQPNPITLNIYPGRSGQYTMYLDDGVSRSSAPQHAPRPKYSGDENAKSEYREIRIEHTYTDANAKTRQIEVKRIHDNYTPKFETYFFVAILHDPSETIGGSSPLKSIKIGDSEISLLTGGTSEQRAADLNNAPNDAWYYNESVNISFAKVFDTSPLISIVANYV